MSGVGAGRLRGWAGGGLLLLLSMVLVSLVVLQEGREPSPPTVDQQAFFDCVPLPRPTSVPQINRFLGSDVYSESFVGADVGASAQLSDGRSIWVFGDTIRSRAAEGPWMVRNSIMVFDEGCASVYVPADRGAAVPNRPDGVGYWPTSVDVVPDPSGKDRVAVGLFRVEGFGDGMWDYRILGSSVARFEVPPDGLPELRGVVDVGADNPADLTVPLWGAAVEVVDDWVYVYATATPDDPWVFGYSLHVARTRVDSYLDLTTWRYWDGREWVRERDAAVPIIPADNGVSRVLTVFRQGAAWYAVSKRNEFFGDELVIWKAWEPTGPFTPGPPVASIPSDDDVMRYMPLAHPDLLPEPGTVVVSWSNNLADPERLLREPMRYRPRFLRVPLP